MRLEVSIEIGGSDLTDGDTGMGEVERIFGRAAQKMYDGVVLEAGDRSGLLDTNGNTVGHVALVPDWTAGDEVWVTTTEGSLLRSVIYSAAAHPSLPGYSLVTCRFAASHELLSAVVADDWGRDTRGRPVLGRVR